MLSGVPYLHAGADDPVCDCIIKGHWGQDADL